MILSLKVFDLGITSLQLYYLHSKFDSPENLNNIIAQACSLFYHAATLLLFQPFINLNLTTSSVIPREVCYQAANAIASLVKSYSDLYTLRRTPSFVPYFVLISTIIHLVAVKTDHANDEIRQKLSQGISDLEDMAQCHGFASRAIDAVHYLANRWGLDTLFENRRGEAFVDARGATSILPDSICPDISILETLQSIQPVLSPSSTPLFSPFPMQGLPLVARGSQLEKEGFTLAPREPI